MLAVRDTLASLPLLLLATSLLLLLATGGPDLGRLHELCNEPLLLLGVLHLHGLPHFVDLALASRLGLVLHVRLLLLGLHLQVELGQLLVFLAHLLALAPLLQPRLVVLLLVTAKVVLNCTNLHTRESTTDSVSLLAFARGTLTHSSEWS